MTGWDRVELHKRPRIALTNTGPAPCLGEPAPAQAEIIRRANKLRSLFPLHDNEEEVVEKTDAQVREEVRELREFVAEMRAAIFEAYPEIAEKLDAERASA